MRTLIAVPCMDTVHTLFMVSLLSLRKPEGTEVAVSSSSLVYDARHLLAHKAVTEGFDRVLWLDSDMHFGPDLLEKLSADVDMGMDFVSALYFTRKQPITPCVYESCHNVTNERGEVVPKAEPFRSVPNGIFEIEGAGFGAVLMTTDLIRRCGKLPFFPREGYGEDFSFCLRARETGAQLFCDSRIVADHIGTTLINDKVWRGE